MGQLKDDEPTKETEAAAREEEKQDSAFLWKPRVKESVNKEGAAVMSAMFRKRGIRSLDYSDLRERKKETGQMEWLDMHGRKGDVTVHYKPLENHSVTEGRGKYNKPSRIIRPSRTRCCGVEGGRHRALPGGPERASELAFLRHRCLAETRHVWSE